MNCNIEGRLREAKQRGKHSERNGNSCTTSKELHFHTHENSGGKVEH